MIIQKGAALVSYLNTKRKYDKISAALPIHSKILMTVLGKMPVHKFKIKLSVIFMKHYTNTANYYLSYAGGINYGDLR